MRASGLQSLRDKAGPKFFFLTNRGRPLLKEGLFNIRISSDQFVLPCLILFFGGPDIGTLRRQHPFFVRAHSREGRSFCLMVFPVTVR